VATEVLSIERGTNRMFRQARFVHELTHLVGILAEGERGCRLESQALQQELAIVWAELSIHRLHIMKLVSRIIAGEKIGAEVSINKLFWSEMHQRLARLGIDVLGADVRASGHDSASEGRFQDIYLQTRSETIYAGTSQVQRNIIAERVLGMPR
jgi:alkylation response protein AidB-like acyl-CoA dehydrogenase